MTIEQARECIPNFKAFENEFCNSCVENDWDLIRCDECKQAEVQDEH